MIDCELELTIYLGGSHDFRKPIETPVMNIHLMGASAGVQGTRRWKPLGHWDHHKLIDISPSGHPWHWVGNNSIVLETANGHHWATLDEIPDPLSNTMHGAGTAYNLRIGTGRMRTDGKHNLFWGVRATKAGKTQIELEEAPGVTAIAIMTLLNVFYKNSAPTGWVYSGSSGGGIMGAWGVAAGGGAASFSFTRHADKAQVDYSFVGGGVGTPGVSGAGSLPAFPSAGGQVVAPAKLASNFDAHKFAGGIYLINAGGGLNAMHIGAGVDGYIVLFTNQFARKTLPNPFSIKAAFTCTGISGTGAKTRATTLKAAKGGQIMVFGGSASLHRA